MELDGPLTDDDMAGLAELFNASARVAGLPVNYEADQMPEELAEPFVCTATDSQTVHLDQRLAGAVYTYHLAGDGTGDETVYVMGGVHPDFRGRGLGRELFAWGLSRARDILGASTSGAPRFIRASTQLADTAAHRIFERHGLVPVRWFEDLRRRLDDGTLAAVPASDPEGVRITPWNPARTEEARLVKNAAFADHWGSTPTSAEGWRQSTSGYGTRLDLSFMALDADDTIVGIALNNRYASDDAVTDGPQAWVGTLATLRPWRGRGVGTALVARSLHAFAADGITYAAIGVDSDNPTGARRLYAALGFEPWLRQVCHQLAV